jgi:hypothetical protein
MPAKDPAALAPGALLFPGEPRAQAAHQQVVGPATPAVAMQAAEVR